VRDALSKGVISLSKSFRSQRDSLPIRSLPHPTTASSPSFFFLLLSFLPFNCFSWLLYVCPSPVPRGLVLLSAVQKEKHHPLVTSLFLSLFFLSLTNLLDRHSESLFFLLLFSVLLEIDCRFTAHLALGLAGIPAVLKRVRARERGSTLYVTIKEGAALPQKRQLLAVPLYILNWSVKRTKQENSSS
jgi:hypothetical protein